MTPPAILLHFGGAGTYTAAATIAAMFVALFALSFFVGSRPRVAAGRLSREWAWTWLRASLLRLLITGAFCAGLFIASSLSGNSAKRAAACAQPLAPMSGTPVTGERLQAAVQNMRDMVDAAGAGDVSTAQGFFFGDTHSVTHDIDRPLRDVDPGLGKDLCRRVLTLESQLAGERNGGVIAREGSDTADLLEDAGRELGLTP